MNKAMLYPVDQAVRSDIATAWDRAVEMEPMPLFAIGRSGGMDGSGLCRYSDDTKKLPDSMGSGSFSQLLPG